MGLIRVNLGAFAWPEGGGYVVSLGIGGGLGVPCGGEVGALSSGILRDLGCALLQCMKMGPLYGVLCLGNC